VGIVYILYRVVLAKDHTSILVYGFVLMHDLDLAVRDALTCNVTLVDTIEVLPHILYSTYTFTYTYTQAYTVYTHTLTRHCVGVFSVDEGYHYFLSWTR
jgi:hypothetical protein